MSIDSSTTPRERRHLRVTGVVQGVGFRPYVYGLARRLGLTGLVGNDSRGVFIELEGPSATLDAFHSELVGNPPPLAHIVRVDVETREPRGDVDFVIVESEAQAGAHTLSAGLHGERHGLGGSLGTQALRSTPGPLLQWRVALGERSAFSLSLKHAWVHESTVARHDLRRTVVGGTFVH